MKESPTEEPYHLIERATETPSLSGEPDIRFDAESHDLGTIFQMRSYECTFKFRNAGTAKLVVKRASSSCGCAAPVLSAKELEPGEEAELMVALESGMSEGAVVRSIMVRSNDPDEPVKKLKIESNVVARLPVKPKSIYFRKIRKSEGATLSLDVGPSEVEAIRSVAVRSTTEHFTPQLQLVDREGGRWRLDVAVADDAPLGRSAGWIEVFLNGETEPCSRVRVTAYLVGDIDVEPRRLTFRFKPGTDADLGTINATSGTGKTFRVFEVESDTPVIETELLPVEEGKQYSVVAHLSSEAPAGRVRGNITIHTDDAEQRKIVVPVFGVVE